MEINKFDHVKGVVTTAATVAGRIVGLVSHSTSVDFGSLTDLPGAAVPATADKAKGARYVIDFQPTQQSGPYYATMPTVATFAERGGFASSENTSWSTPVDISYPGWKTGKTIPANTTALAYSKGTFSFVSGEYIYNSSLLTAGAWVVAANTAEDSTDAGKLKYQATFDDRVIGVVRNYDSTTGVLIVDIDMP